MDQSLLYSLQIAPPSPTVFVLLCYLGAILSTAAALWLLAENVWRIARPAYMVSAGVNVLFQWPVALLSSTFEASLPNSWLFAASVNLPPLLLLGWVSLTKRLDIPKATVSTGKFTTLQVLLPVALSGLFLGLYLLRVPYDCTAAYAVLFDPQATLLAREFAGKIAVTRVSGYSIGAMVNSTAPAALALTFWTAAVGFRRKQIFVVTASILTSLVLVGIVLMTGAKGLLIPSFLALAISAVVWAPGKLLKPVAAIALVGLLAISVVGFELVRERAGFAGDSGAYQIGACAARTGECERTTELVTSMMERHTSLGVTPARLQRILGEMDISCPQAIDAASEFLKGKGTQRIGELQTAADAAQVIAPRETGIIERGLRYAESIAYRMMVTPVQVGSWHFLYAAELGSPGWSAMPIGRQLTGQSMNMPERVYQQYGSIFSGGDRTSTGTSPTSFFLAYPAYIGWPGVALAIVLMIAFDIVWAAITMLLPRPLLGLAVGLLAVVSMNFLLSDFLTVMFTHGGLVASALLVLLGLTSIRRRAVSAVAK